MRVRLGDAAQRDLEDILYGLAATDPARAKLISRAFRTLSRSIALAPMIGSPAGSAHGTRKRSLPPYQVLYLVRREEILILRIVHERSDWVSLV